MHDQLLPMISEYDAVHFIKLPEVFVVRTTAMDYHVFTDESLTTMYFCVRAALAADDELFRLGAEPRFRVRDTPAWKKHAADLEAEMPR
jgi:hypothetical protein